MRRSAWLLMFLIGCAASTPAPKTCRDRADEAYQRCINPYFVAQGEELAPTRSDEAQQCRAAYQQSLSACGESPEGLTKTSTISPIPSVD